MTWVQKKSPENDITLNEYDLKELSIIKQAILKSAIEGGQIGKEKGETDEQFVMRWVKFVRRNKEADKKVFEEQDAF